MRASTLTPWAVLPLLGACSGGGMDADAGAGEPDAGVIDAGPVAEDAGPAVGRDAGRGFDAGAGDGGPPVELDAGPPPCTYPEGASETMTVGGVLWPYRWPVSLEADRTARMLDLADAPCDDAVDIDWSPFDVLVFISIPAW